MPLTSPVEYLKHSLKCAIIQKLYNCEKPVENFLSTHFPIVFPIIL